MKKCELAVHVAFPWTENVKVAETEPLLALASAAPSHIICTLWKMLSLWVDYLLTSFTGMWDPRRSDSLSDGSEAEIHIISSDTMWLWPESLPAREAGGSVAQIGRVGGNQFGLGEAFNSYNHSFTLEKRSSNCWHTETIMPMFREKVDRLRGGQTD